MTVSPGLKLFKAESRSASTSTQEQEKYDLHLKILTLENVQVRMFNELGRVRVIESFLAISLQD